MTIVPHQHVSRRDIYNRMLLRCHMPFRVTASIHFFRWSTMLAAFYTRCAARVAKGLYSTERHERLSIAHGPWNTSIFPAGHVHIAAPVDVSCRVD